MLQRRCSTGPPVAIPTQRSLQPLSRCIGLFVPELNDSLRLLLRDSFAVVLDVPLVPLRYVPLVALLDDPLRPVLDPPLVSQLDTPFDPVLMYDAVVPLQIESLARVPSE
ncbi:hypothetical protein AURDEDRAFT_176222 [Auricularia subglabra TFB-10046 SS5]|uniref:Uncharacterized protein n=1 Tax=Auricularia subglabra (strain TFB-10046 / SS5) TaxID=717982 RepID=J0WQC6_AURST|nr:hypothetical protein AURDEDRAFT_176222 [Auricularia subglabra TFB-10046 SS5]